MQLAHLRASPTNLFGFKLSPRSLPAVGSPGGKSVNRFSSPVIGGGLGIFWQELLGLARSSSVNSEGPRRPAAQSWWVTA